MTKKWQNRDAKQSKRMKRMIGGKMDTGIMTAQSRRSKPIFFCKGKCKDIRKFKNGRCKKCGWKYGGEEWN